MQKALRKELALITGLSSLGFFLIGKKRWGYSTGALSLGLQFLPTKDSAQFFSRKTVVITGGSRGLGLSLARMLVERNARVVLLARDRQELDRAEAELNQRPHAEVLTVECDVCDRSQVDQAISQIKREMGAIDILINNAGAMSVGPFESMSRQDFESQMNIHFYAALNCVQAVLPTMKRQKTGQIVNICSIGGKIPVPHLAPYCASKFAMSGFSLSLAAELFKDNICVTTVYPGLMRTGSPVQGHFKGDYEKEYAWFALSDSSSALSVSAEDAASQILEATANKQSELIISLPAKAAWLFHGIFPEVFSRFTGWINKILPQDFSPISHQGASSVGWLRRHRWTRGYQKELEKAQREHNQQPGDPTFNTSLH